MSKTIRLKGVAYDDVKFYNRFENEVEYDEARVAGDKFALRYRDWKHYQKKIRSLAYSDNHAQTAGNRANVSKDDRHPMDTSWRHKQSQKLKKAVDTGESDEYSQDKHFKNAGYFKK